MILNQVNGKNLDIEIWPTAHPFGSRFESIQLSANDMDVLAKLTPEKLHEWAKHIQTRFPPRKGAQVVDELADLLS